MAEARKMDMTEGSLGDKILLFVIPVAITAILQQLLNTTDSIVVGQFVGDGAVAAVGGNAAIISFIVSLFQGISLGANVVIATAIGARDERSVHEGVHTAIVIAVVGGILSAIACELLVEPIAICTGRDETEIANEIGDAGSGALKAYVTQAVNDYFAPIRARREELAQDRAYILDVLHEGNRKANEIAEATLDEVREAMGMVY